MKLSPYDYYEPNVFFIRSNNINKYAKQFFNICNCDAKYKCCGDFSCPCFIGFGTCDGCMKFKNTFNEDLYYDGVFDNTYIPELQSTKGIKRNSKTWRYLAKRPTKNKEKNKIFIMNEDIYY